MIFKEITFKDLPQELQVLLEDANRVKANSYNIYSNYAVGASVKTKTGITFKGTNMENASYGLSVCAEVGAIQSAYSNGDKEIVSIAIIGGEAGGKIPSPCGRCRQLINEAAQVSSTDIEVVLSNADMSNIIHTTISQLLPLPFGPDDLFNDQE